MLCDCRAALSEPPAAVAALLDALGAAAPTNMAAFKVGLHFVCPHFVVHTLLSTLRCATYRRTSTHPQGKLDGLARMAGENGKRRASILHLYMSAPSGVAAARAALPPIGPTGWTLDSPTRAPPELADALMASDAGAQARCVLTLTVDR
jgi:hypothetical protein